MLRIDGNTRETASAMLHIHALVMSLNYSAIEIKIAQSLESWNGGVLVMASGSIYVKDFNGRRKFVQTFFLAPQEKGYFVLNDIFHFIDEQPIHQNPVAYSPQCNLDPKYNASTDLREQVPSYMLGGKIQAGVFPEPGNVEENGTADNYSFQEERLKQVAEAENILEEDFVAQQPNGSLRSTMNNVQDHFSVPVEEPIGEPPKHTYASIVAKGQSVSSLSLSSINKITSPRSEWHKVSEPPSQQAVAIERSGADASEDVSAIEDEVEIKSVYVRNVPSTMSASEIEEEFKRFGKLRPDGVAIRTRKDIDVCYAFVEFEDIIGVQNAIKASTVRISRRQVYIEERRANRGNSSRGRGRGRGRGRSRNNYLTDAGRGRFVARSYGRESGPDGSDRDYNRAIEGYYCRGSQQDRMFSGNQQPTRYGLNKFE